MIQAVRFWAAIGTRLTDGKTKPQPVLCSRAKFVRDSPNSEVTKMAKSSRLNEARPPKPANQGNAKAGGGSIRPPEHGKNTNTGNTTGGISIFNHTPGRGTRGNMGSGNKRDRTS